MIRYISTTILIFLTTINIHAQVADSIYSLGSKFYNSNAAARFGKQALREDATSRGTRLPKLGYRRSK